MDGGAAVGGGGDGGHGPGPNFAAAGPDNPAEDKCVTVEYPNDGMVDLDSGSVVLARRPAFAEEFKPEDYQNSEDPDVSDE